MRNTILPSLEEFKKEAKTLRENNLELKSHGEALNKLAMNYGHRSWKAIRPLLKEGVPHKRVLPRQ